MKFKFQYFDEEGDVCLREFTSATELSNFINSLSPKDIIGLVDEEMEEILLMSMKFPPNKVN